MINLKIEKKKEDLIIIIGKKKKTKFHNAHVSGYSTTLKKNNYGYIEISYYDKDSKSYKAQSFKNVKATRELDWVVWSMQ